MGKTGCCYDNARMESFFATLKKELIYQLPLSQLTRKEIKRLIFRWVECNYNTERPTSANENSCPPLVKRLLYYAAIRKAALTGTALRDRVVDLRDHLRPVVGMD